MALLLCFQNSSQAAGVLPNPNFFTVHDFQDDWQVFDEKYQTYVPYLKSRHQNYRSFSVFFNLEDSKGYHLLYYSPNENYLFINASLQKKLPANQWITLSSDSLTNIYHKSAIFLTFYSNTPGLADKTVLIGNRKKIGQTAITIADEQQSTPLRNILPYKNFFVIIGLFLLLSYAFLISLHSRAFDKYFSIRDLITIGKRSDSFADRPFDVSNLLVLGYLCLVLSYIYLLVINTNTDASFVKNQTLLDGTVGFWGIFWIYLKISVAGYFLFLIKYVGLTLLGQLYNLEKVVNVHYFKIIQASSIFFTCIMCIVIFFYFAYPHLAASVYNSLIFIIISFFVIRLALLFFAINKLSPLKNLYLFSYLCIVELLPIIVSVRFAL